MNWSDERYVRVYVRDTVEWLAWSWQAQALFLLLLRKVDRAGCLDLPADKAKAARGLSRMVGMPEDVIAECLPELEESGAIVGGERGLMVRNYVAAQEAVASNAERQRRYKERQAAITERHDASPVGIEAHQEVTRDNAETRAVTPSVPYLAEPSLAEPKESAASPPRARARKAPGAEHRAVAAELWAEQNRMRREAIADARDLAATDSALKLVADRIAEGYTREDCLHVLGVYAAEAKASAEQARWFNGQTNWRPENFRRALGRSTARASPDPRRGSVRPLAAHEYPVGDQEI